MRSLIKSFMAAVLMCLVSACVSNPVSTDYNPQFAFSSVKTYGWLSQGGKQKDPLLYNDLVDERIRRAVDEQMSARGWVRVEEKPDVLVTYHLGLKDKIRIDHFYDEFGYYPCYYCRPYGYHRAMYPGRDVSVRQYTEGTLAIDVIDTSNMNMVWRGSLSRVVRSLQSPEEREAVVREVVQQILTGLPN